MKISEFIAKNGRPFTKERGEYLFRQGDCDQSLYVIKRGLLKAYYLSPDGKESIKSFLLPGDKIGSLKGVYGEKRCSFSLVCLEPCELIAIRFDDLYESCRSNLEMAREVIDFLIAFAMKKETREYELLCLTPEDRFRRLMQTTPQLFGLVTQNEIARYLGVTPVGLSRIKKRVMTTA